MNLSETWIVQQLEKRTNVHVFFALTLLVILLLIVLSSRYAIDLLPRALFIYCFILASVYAGRWLGWIWLVKRTLFAVVIASATLFSIFSAAGIYGWIFVSHYHSENFFVTIPLFTALFMTLGAGAKIARAVIKQQITEANLLRLHKESELNLLTSQLSPHFLFNTLNNIYGLAIQGDQQVPNYLVKLSTLLRYSVYVSNERLVPLGQEVDYLLNYIDFESIRIGKKLQLAVSVDPVNKALPVAPMLLVPFIENAFKHSKNATGQSVRIDIQLTSSDSSIDLFVRNSHKHASRNDEPDRSGGMGLQNARKRLALLYPDKYNLTLEDDNDYFTARLRIITS
ncbi:histidine kinase [Spirosoma sp. RP8]|uniref:Histidine kinase n=1 Tax=Spirosoma liriopis TaxID=2937440 RepID=A0ABT0HSU7_9BACT|nr:histidine kinase [Spirosoma liriopis]